MTLTVALTTGQHYRAACDVAAHDDDDDECHRHETLCRTGNRPDCALTSHLSMTVGYILVQYLASRVQNTSLTPAKN